MRKSILVTALGLCASASFAALTTTGPFVGTSSEDFESFQNYNIAGPQSNLSVFGGAGTFTSSSSPQMYVYSPANSATWGLGGNGSAIVHGGENGLGIYNSQADINATLTFTNAVSSFGGYFADVDFAATTMTFFDANGNNLGTGQFEHAGNSMDWYGWSASEGIKSIVFSPGNAPVMDDLQINGNPAVPEPASMTALGLGVVALIRRRRSTK